MALIRGTQRNDTLNGTRSDDDIFGFAGNDTIRAGSGDDYVEGGDGNDLLFGDAGDDRLVGGRGIDTFFGGTGFDVADFAFDETGARGGVTLDLGRTLSSPADEPYAVATVRTGAGSYQERLYGIEDAFGSVGNDSITGSSGSNVLLGDAGQDTLSGGAGADTVWGEAGSDSLDGGSGVNEIATGGGFDTVVFRADDRSDVVLDFDPYRDTLLFAGTGEPRGTTFTELVNDGTIEVYERYDPWAGTLDTVIEYRGSDIVLLDLDPGFLDNGNVLIG